MISVLLFDVRLSWTTHEMIDAIHRAELRKAGKLRLMLQTVLLLLVAAWSLVAFFADGMKETMSAVIGVVALVLIPVMWFAPEWHTRRIAKDAEEQGRFPHLWVFDDGVDFGETPPAGAYYPFGSFRCIFLKENDAFQTLVMVFENSEIVIVKKELLSDEQWETLVKKGG